MKISSRSRCLTKGSGDQAVAQTKHADVEKLQTTSSKSAYRPRKTKEVPVYLNEHANRLQLQPEVDKPTRSLNEDTNQLQSDVEESTRSLNEDTNQLQSEVGESARSLTEDTYQLQYEVDVPTVTLNEDTNQLQSEVGEPTRSLNEETNQLQSDVEESTRSLNEDTNQQPPSEVEEPTKSLNEDTNQLQSEVREPTRSLNEDTNQLQSEVGEPTRSLNEDTNQQPPSEVEEPTKSLNEDTNQLQSEVEESTRSLNEDTYQLQYEVDVPTVSLNEGTILRQSEVGASLSTVSEMTNVVEYDLSDLLVQVIACTAQQQSNDGCHTNYSGETLQQLPNIELFDCSYNLLPIEDDIHQLSQLIACANTTIEYEQGYASNEGNLQCIPNSHAERLVTYSVPSECDEMPSHASHALYTSNLELPEVINENGSLVGSSPVENGTANFTHAVSETVSEQRECHVSEEPTVISRKRKRQPDNWVRNKRRHLRQTGNEYMSIRGKLVAKRKVLQHADDCRFNCCQKFTDDDRQYIHMDFWRLSDIEKKHFFIKTTEKQQKKRTRLGRQVRTEKVRSKTFSYEYYLPKVGVNERVCKSFYLATLNVSQSRVTDCHETKNSQTHTPVPSKQGKHVKHCIPDCHVEAVKEHIRSFPRIASHYRRSNTQKEYLEGGLSISRMYDLFVQKRVLEHENSDDVYIEPIKKHMYSKIFNEHFNLAFLLPKSDRCDNCEAFIKSDTQSIEVKDVHELHVRRKEETKQERDRDRSLSDEHHAVLCFDLQNVIALPRANVSNFFYKRKLNVYNLTGHLATPKTRTAICVLWHEGLSGRTGNDIASSLERMLQEVVKLHPEVSDITLWSDACVPQNKNSVMSTAIIRFLLKHDSVTSVTQKFGEAGHSAIQEVDNVHSQIERRLKTIEVYSPVGLLKALKQVNVKNPLHIIQMKDFYDFQKVARQTNLCEIPYTKVKIIVYTNTRPMVSVKYGCSFTSLTEVIIDEYRAQNVRNKTNTTQDTRKTMNMASSFLSCKRRLSSVSLISSDKSKDIQSMYKYMDNVDTTFYETILRKTKVSDAHDDQIVTSETPKEDDMVDRETASSGKRKKHKSTKKTTEASAQRETLPEDVMVDQKTASATKRKRHTSTAKALSYKETLRKADRVDKETASSSNRKKHKLTAETTETSAQKVTLPEAVMIDQKTPLTTERKKHASTAKATEASSTRETSRKADLVDRETASSNRRKKHKSTAKAHKT